ncbi:MAG TPA: glucose-1-phosphate adenylyltransferase subunit GlgD [Clostridiales bacterium]|nr:glucose-1-phosphate adenylyltransferase subunit GlgD [Clostridiales bacterium]
MDTMGIIFSNVHDGDLKELTEMRTFASVPFGGRYRLIDFVLSNMVNSGIHNIGIVAKANYMSLMDHLGNGREWDLDRKRDGLFIFPPFARQDPDIGVYKGRLEALAGILTYIRRSAEKYVVLANSDIICNMNYRDVIRYHEEKEAEITVIYRKMTVSESNAPRCTYFYFDPDQRLSGMAVRPPYGGEQNVSFNMVVMERGLLEHIVKEASAYHYQSFDRDFLQRRCRDFKVYGYPFEELYLRINSIAGYFDANMRMLDPATRNELFYSHGSIYTKVRDEIPARYPGESMTRNSLIADGCVIEGEVEDSVLFRGVHVGKGARVKKSILMQDTRIGENACLTYTILDKDVVILPERILTGYGSYPVVISKGSIV